MLANDFGTKNAYIAGSPTISTAYLGIYLNVTGINDEDDMIVTRVQPLVSNIELSANMYGRAYKGSCIVEESAEIIEYYETSRIDPFWQFEPVARFLKVLDMNLKIKTT